MSTFTPAPTTSTRPPAAATVADRPTASRRFGYTLAVALNGGMLWIAHQLLDWDWPRFLTDDFDRLLPWVTFSFVTSMVVNAGFLVRDRGRPRALGDLVTSAVALVVSQRTWEVFPFDFVGYARDWAWLCRTLLVIAIVGSAIGVLVNAIKLARG